MPWVSVKLTPGVNAEFTPTQNRAGYSRSWLGRFKAGLFQKMGGWLKFLNYSLAGIPKAVSTWQAIDESKWLAIGTTTSLTVFKGRLVNNVLSVQSSQSITPQTFTSDTTPDFTTTVGSNVVTVTDTNISTITPFCSVFFNTPIAIDGIILSGLYQVKGNLSATSYTIEAATVGAAGVTGGGDVPEFTTVSGSATVNVKIPAHGVSAGGDIVFPIATAVGGLTILGRYVVQSVVDADNFTIAAINSASSSQSGVAMNGGDAELLYYIAIGPLPSAAGYGTGAYGAGAYGLGIVVPGMTGATITATNWTLSNWGQDLVACQEGGPIFYWPPEQGILGAQVIPNSPPFNEGAFVSTSQQTIIAYGSSVEASIGVYHDPMLVKWCDIQDFTDWDNTSTTNQAGDYRIPTGSRLIAGTAIPGCNLIWSDVELWALTYIGAQFVYSFTSIGSNCGIIGKHAFAKLASSVYWLGRNNIFALSGGTVAVLPCSVWDVIFQDLDTENEAACWVGSNTLFGEVIICYPSISDGLGYPSRYVKFNTIENTWDYGPLQRNCWTDQTAFGPPIACTQDGVVYVHETGNDADVQPIASGFTTGYFYLDEGRSFVFIDEIIPDFKLGKYGQSQDADIQITVSGIDDVNDTPVQYGPFIWNASSKKISTRIRARQVSLTVQSEDSGSFWRLGQVRFRYTLDGRR